MVTSQFITTEPQRELLFFFFLSRYCFYCKYSWDCPWGPFLHTDRSWAPPSEWPLACVSSPSAGRLLLSPAALPFEGLTSCLPFTLSPPTSGVPGLVFSTQVIFRSHVSSPCFFKVRVMRALAFGGHAIWGTKVKGKSNLPLPFLINCAIINSDTGSSHHDTGG